MNVLPPDVHDLLTKAQLICGGVVVGVGSLMGMVAGLMRVLGLREEGKRRYKDALAGMAMVLTAPAVFGTLATLIKLFFPKTYA